MGGHARRPSTHRNNFQRFQAKKFKAKATSRIDFLDREPRGKEEEAYTNSRDSNTLYDLYSHTAKSSQKRPLFGQHRPHAEPDRERGGKERDSSRM